MNGLKVPGLCVPRGQGTFVCCQAWVGELDYARGVGACGLPFFRFRRVARSGWAEPDTFLFMFITVFCGGWCVTLLFGGDKDVETGCFVESYINGEA